VYRLEVAVLTVILTMDRVRIPKAPVNCVAFILIGKRLS
jgi:hypothetical protein